MVKRAIGAFISGCLGLELTAAEAAFFARTNPFGLILFKRNCESAEQVLRLTSSFRDAVGRKDAPVLIDQEGGRVQRMGPPVWRKHPATSQFGKLYEKDKLAGLRTARHCGRLMAEELLASGVTVNCLPVLDLSHPGTTDAIASRTYAASPEAALLLARSHVAGMMEGGVLPVMKHIPGHGRATVDSHHELPVVQASRSQLESHDFLPFAGFADCPMAMTAHVIYENIDAKRPATQSKYVIRDVVRKQLGYNGLIMTDDLSMKALSGSFSEKVRLALDAGIDVMLHCHAIMDEMEEVAAAAGVLKGKSLVRAKAALRARRKPQIFDRKAALKDWAALEPSAAVS